MSDSEVEFQSADEGSNDDVGWEIECDFDVPDAESSAGFKPTEMKIFNSIETEQNIKSKHEDLIAAENSTSNSIPSVQAELGKLSLKNDNTNSEQYIGSKVVQNEIESTSTQSNVSYNVN